MRVSQVSKCTSCSPCWSNEMLPVLRSVAGGSKVRLWEALAVC